MSYENRKKIGFWFFLLIGILGLSTMMYWFIAKKYELNITESITCIAVFGVFVFKPTILIDLFEKKINK